MNTSSVSILFIYFLLALDTCSGSSKYVYIDGDEAATSTHSDTITFYSQEVWIGRGNYGGYFNGKIATAQFYNTALSHQQVKEIYNSQRGRYGK